MITHYKDENLGQPTWAYMDKQQINRIIDCIQLLVHQCQENGG